MHRLPYSNFHFQTLNYKAFALLLLSLGVFSASFWVDNHDFLMRFESLVVLLVAKSSVQNNAEIPTGTYENRK